MSNILSAIPTRIYTPQDESGMRYLTHPETITTNIIDPDTGLMLNQSLSNIRPTISKDKPDHSCLWFNVSKISSSMFD